MGDHALKFPQGPWAARKTNIVGSPFGCIFEVIRMNDGINSSRAIVVLHAARGERSVEEAKAIAHLIAAAPEMYDMLATIENDSGQVPEWLWSRIQGVLRKARGEE